MPGFLLTSHIPYYINSVLVLVHLYVTEYYQQPFIFLWLTYSVIPMIDQFIPDDNVNPTPEEAKVLKTQYK